MDNNDREAPEMSGASMRLTVALGSDVNVEWVRDDGK
jgi:hypothetical protein